MDVLSLTLITYALFSSPEPVELPTNQIWITLDLDGHNDNPDLPVLKIRGGSIIVLQNPMQYVNEKPVEEYTLLVALDEDGKAQGLLYEDEGLLRAVQGIVMTWF